MKYVTRGGLVLLLLAGVALFAAGCGQEKDKPVQAEKKDADKSKKESKHDEWWCEEHGLPEAECILCSEKLKNDAKAKGDWCQHNRAKSQCFECDPSLKEKFAAKYRAKYPGKEPPKPTDYD